MQQPSPSSPNVHVGACSGTVHTPSRKVTRSMDSSSSEFSFAKAMALQTELFEAFSQDVFQQQLRALTLEHDRSSAAFKKARHELVLTVQQRILPKFGFEGNLTGVLKMIHAFGPYYPVGEFNELWIRSDALLGIDRPRLGSKRSDAIFHATADALQKGLWSSDNTSKLACISNSEPTVQDAFSKAPVPWRRGACAFAAMLHDMQLSNVCGRPIMAKLSMLLIREPIWNVYDTVGFNMSEFIYDMVQSIYMPTDQQPSMALGNLLCNLEKRAAVATQHMDPACDWSSNLDVLNEETLRVLTAATSGGHRFHSFEVGSRHMICIALPLALYVKHNPHLYELLKRMRALGHYLGNGFSAQEALDKWKRPYSALAYAIMAALQMLHAEASEVNELGGKQHGDSLRALRPLQGDSWDVSRPDSSSESVPGLHTPLMFRGIWVPSSLDEAQATYQWSFNSFSRCLKGVCHVLNFYAGIEGSETWQLATQECHVLFMVARHAQGLKTVARQDWAFPVEFFNGSFGDLEQELLVPPFAAYTFETECELSGSMPLEEQLSRIQKLETRWSMKPGSLLESAPLLRDLLDGYAEPLRHTLDEDCWTPKVTVRFITSIHIADPVRGLFEGSSCSLWDFPAVLSDGQSARSQDLQRRSLHEQWLEGAERFAMRQAEYESRRAECWRSNKDELLSWEGAPLELQTKDQSWLDVA